MALIEGFGDEVVHFFLILFLLLIAVLAWWSTKISERPLTVLIFERRHRRSTSQQTVDTPATEDKPDGEGTSSTTNAPVEEVPTVTAAPASSNPSDPRVTFTPETVERPIFPNFVRNLENRIHGSSSSSLGDLPSATSVYTDMSQAQEPQPPQPRSGIRIRLKYLNDDSKLVESSLEERVGDFKRKHFSPELSGRKLVRLIFKGQVLGQDTFTLGHYGLFDNCVVHCLVHQARTPPPSPNLNTRDGSQPPQAAPVVPWALSNVLLAALSFLLGIAWYGRYQYAQLYSATTTVALVGLTGIFTISLIGIYMPDPAPR